jgi:hypothetical protein
MGNVSLESLVVLELGELCEELLRIANEILVEPRVWAYGGYELFFVKIDCE